MQKRSAGTPWSKAEEDTLMQRFPRGKQLNKNERETLKATLHRRSWIAVRVARVACLLRAAHLMLRSAPDQTEAQTAARVKRRRGSGIRRAWQAAAVRECVLSLTVTRLAS